MADMTRVNIGMTVEMKEHLQSEAERQGISMTALVVVMLNQSIENKKIVESMRNIDSVLDRIEKIESNQNKKNK